jgi:hypothetical protein
MQNAAENENVISLAEYRQGVFPAHMGPPPPAPCPRRGAQARRDCSQGEALRGTSLRPNVRPRRHPRAA